MHTNTRNNNNHELKSVVTIQITFSQQQMLKRNGPARLHAVQLQFNYKDTLILCG